MSHPCTMHFILLVKATNFQFDGDPHFHQLYCLSFLTKGRLAVIFCEKEKSLKLASHFV